MNDIDDKNLKANNHKKLIHAKSSIFHDSDDDVDDYRETKRSKTVIGGCIKDAKYDKANSNTQNRLLFN